MSMYKTIWIIIASCLFVAIETGCPSTTVNIYAEQGPKYITSPNYPNFYGVYKERLSCSWQITTSPGYDDVVIQMQVINSSMEPATGCGRDSVEIIDGTHSFHPSLISWCGSSWPSDTIVTMGMEFVDQLTHSTHSFHPSLISWCGSSWPSDTIVTTGSAALVQFSTNFKDNDYYGFMLAYWMAKKPRKIVHTTEWTEINYVLIGISVILFGSAFGFFFLIFLSHVIKRCQMTEDEIYAKKYL